MRIPLNLSASELHIRLYTLPEGKRYPDDRDEYATILGRHNKLLDELNPGDMVFVAVSSWTNSPDPPEHPEFALVNPVSQSVFWQTIDEDPEETDKDFKSYRHMFVCESPWRDGALDSLWQAVAEDKVAGVIIAPQDFAWLYCPYDGGVDIVLKSQQLHDAVTSAHPEWLA